MREQLIQAKVMAVLNHRDSPCRVWRNNVGFDELNKVHYGLSKGSSDLIGLVQVVITPAMVGKTVALFLPVEIKTPKGRLRPEQEAWATAMKKLHSLSELHRSEEDARAFVEKAKNGTLFQEAA